jgi:hypothetical protein
MAKGGTPQPRWGRSEHRASRKWSMPMRGCGGVPRLPCPIWGTPWMAISASITSHECHRWSGPEHGHNSRDSKGCYSPLLLTMPLKQSGVCSRQLPRRQVLQVDVLLNVEPSQRCLIFVHPGPLIGIPSSRIGKYTPVLLRVRRLHGIRYFVPANSIGITP